MRNDKHIAITNKMTEKWKQQLTTAIKTIISNESRKYSHPKRTS